MKKAKYTGKETTIVGVVEEFEEEGHFGLIIVADDDDYVVEPNKQGKRLTQALDMDVEATGFITKTSDGTKRITVTNFEVLGSYDDDDETYSDDDDTRRWS